MSVAEIANVSLQEDFRGLAAQGGTQIGLVAPSTDEDITKIVAQKAQEHGIALRPEQMTVRRTDFGGKTTLHIAAHYAVSVKCWLFSLNLVSPLRATRRLFSASSSMVGDHPLEKIGIQEIG